MNAILDIMGSSFIAGMVLFLMINLNLFTSQVSLSSDNELTMQQNAKTLAEIINYDFRKIGYNHNGTAILIAEEKRIKFVAGLSVTNPAGIGTVDTVEYFVEDSLGTSNTDEISLVRVLNNKIPIASPSLGLVKLKFSYEDSTGTITNDLAKIKYIHTELWVKPVNRANNFVTGIKDSVFTYWEFKIYPRNI
jgi:hypothetical protein